MQNVPEEEDKEEDFILHPISYVSKMFLPLLSRFVLWRSYHVQCHWPLIDVLVVVACSQGRLSQRHQVGNKQRYSSQDGHLQGQEGDSHIMTSLCYCPY
jgi:hypothetical protein